MAKIAYYSIQAAVRTILMTGLTGQAATNVYIERPRPLSCDLDPFISIFGRGRSAPADRQYIASHTRMSIEWQLSIWVWANALTDDTLAGAIQARDNYLGDIEILIMQNPTLSATVDSAWCEGGDMDTGKDARGLYVGGEVLVRVLVDAVN